jgi:iron complex outermembrane receptor protein
MYRCQSKMASSRVMCLLAICAPIAVYGQTADEAKPGGPGSRDASAPALQEVVVTAQKRSENVQDVPIAVTALSAESLANKGIEGTADLIEVIPGLSYSTAAGAASPRIRGVGSTLVDLGNEPSVSTYVDGVYYASAAASILSLNNIDQIAVLKGPQGTLFGRNATGGLIQITTRDPTQETVAEGDVTYGNLNTIGTSAYLAGGLTNIIAADLAVYYKDQRDGFGRNLFNGDPVNTSSDVAVRSKWKAQLDDATDAMVILDFARTAGNVPAVRSFSGELPLTGVPYTGRPFDVDTYIQPWSKVSQYGASLHFNHEFDAVKLVSISAYRQSTWNTLFSTDGLPVDIVNNHLTIGDAQITQEFQLLSTAPGPLRWVAGAYFFDAQGGFDPGTIVTAPGLNFNETLNDRQDTKSYAGFGQASYKLTDTTSATLGLRFTSEKKTFDGSANFYTLNPATNTLLGPVPPGTETTVNKPTWRAEIDHHFNQDVLVYGSYNRGFKSGGFDPTSLSTVVKVKPEVLDAYETGIKSEWLDQHIRMNAATYYYNYKDIQLNAYENSLPTTYNGTLAEIYGLDLDLAVVPMDGLTLTMGLALVHDRFVGNFPVSQTSTVPTGGLVELPNISADGKELPNTPDLTVNVGVEYRVPLPTGSLTLSADYFHSDRWYNEPENRTYQPQYSLVNASLAWAFGAHGRYSVKLWGRNLGNVAYASQIFNQVPISDDIAMAEGRTYGITLGAKL